MADAEILVQFGSKGDNDVLEAVKKVTRHVNDLRRIGKTAINLDIVKGSMATEDFERVKKTVLSARAATRDWTKETEKLWREQQKLGAAAQVAGDKAAAAAAKAAAAYAKANPSMGGITGSMMGGGRGGGPFPLGNPMASPDASKFSTKSVDALNKSLGETSKKAQAAAQGLGFVGRIIAAMAVRTFVREVYEMANAWTAFENKIKTVLTVQSDLAFVTKDLIAISQRSRTSLEAVGTIYTRTSRAVQALGKSQIDTARFTETLSKAVAVGGSTSIEAQNAMVQLSQGMSSGTLKGDELRSVLEQLPIVAQLIADKMGVTVGQLRKLGSEGKLTTDVVFGAILDSTAKIEAQFAKMKPTMESIVQVIKDKFMVAIGQSSGLLDMVTKALQVLSNNFDVAFKAAEAFAGAMAVLGTGKILSMVASIGLGWGGVAAAIIAATVAYAAFSDKISASDDGIMKLSNATHVWTSTFKADLLDIVKTLELASTGFLKLLGFFTADVKYSHSWDLMFDRLAMITDMVRVIANPAMMGMALAGDKDAMEFAGRTQRNLRRERALAKGAEKDAFWVKQQETEARFNAMMRGNMPTGEGSPAAPAKKGPKEHGKTFDELIKEAMFDERNSLWSETEEKIRDRLHNMMEKLKPSIKAALDDIGANKQIAAMEAEFKKEHTKEKYLLDPEKEERDRKNLDAQVKAIRSKNAELLKERDTLEDIVRQEATREFYAKQKKEDEKEMEAFLDERIKQMKEMEDLNRSMLEEAADKQVARVDKFQGIASSLDPNVAIREQIKALEDFNRFATENRLADWAKLSKDRIEELKASMRWENTHFETFADQMNSIFGPGGSLVKGFADAAANALVMSQSLGELRKALVDVLNSVQKQALSSLIQLPMNLALGALTNSLVGGGATSSLTSEAGGVRMLSAAEASTVGQPKFASGGYTGDVGTNTPAGIVHGQEFVLNADATRRMGRQNLEMINKGGSVASSSSGNSAQVTVHNYAGVQVETSQLSPSQVEIMITRAIWDQTGKVVAGQINDPNSHVARSLQKNINSERRRT